MSNDPRTRSRLLTLGRLASSLLCLALAAQLGDQAGTPGCVVDDSEPNDACLSSVLSSSTPLQDGEVRALNFCDDADDWFSFNACTGHSYTIRTFDLAPAADTVLELYDRDCQTLQQVDDDGGGGRASLIQWGTRQGGTYHVRVRQADGSTGPDRDYRLSLVGRTATCRLWVGVHTQFGDDEVSRWIAQTADGGYVVAGSKFYWGGVEDGWVMRLDPDGEALWERTYDSETWEGLRAIEPSPAGGFYAAGIKEGPLLWVLRLDDTGAILWGKTYGYAASGYGASVIPTPDGGCIVAKGASGLTVIRLDFGGQILWQQSSGATAAGFTPLRPTRDGGFVVVADRNLGEEIRFSRFAPDGSLVWSKNYDTYWWLEGVYDVRQLADGGFVLANAIDVTIGEEAIPHVAILRVDESGEVLWYRMFDIDDCVDGDPRVTETVGGDIVFVARGHLRIDGSCADEICWVARLDGGDGTIQAQSSYARDQHDSCRALVASADGGVAIAGQIYAGATWVFHLDQDVGSDSSCLGSPNGSGETLSTTMSDLASDVVSTVTPVANLVSETDDPTVSTHYACWQGVQARPSEVSPPGAEQILEFSNAFTLRWEKGQFSGSDEFNLYRGSVSDLPTGGAACLKSAIPTEQTIVTDEPPSGVSWYYLVTGENAKGEGPLGIGSHGQARENVAPCP